MNGSGDDVSLGSVSDSYADVILERVIDFGIVGYRIGWSPLHLDFPCYHLSFAGGFGPFPGVDPLLPTLDPLPVYATTPALGPYHHTARVPRHPTSFGGSGLILLPGQILPLLADTPYPRTLFVFFPATWIYEKILPNRFGRALPNALQTFPLLRSQSNHSFVGEPHGGHQLCVPEMRLLGPTSLGLTTYL